AHTGAPPRDAAPLTGLGFESLLMLPLLAPDGPWGLAEIYVNGRQVGQDDVPAARPLRRAFGERGVGAGVRKYEACEAHGLVVIERHGRFGAAGLVPDAEANVSLSVSAAEV